MPDENAPTETLPTDTVRTLRLVGFVEGLSFLVLLFVAMPLKYALHQPLAVRVVGMLHGVLFVAFLLALTRTAVQRRWSLGDALSILVSGLLPFGFLLVERRLRREIGQTART